MQVCTEVKTEKVIVLILNKDEASILVDAVKMFADSQSGKSNKTKFIKNLAKQFYEELPYSLH